MFPKLMVHQKWKYSPPNKLQWDLLSNEWYRPQISDAHPKMSCVLQKWVILPPEVPQSVPDNPKMGDVHPKKEGCFSESNDDPKRADLSQKWVVLPQNGCSPQKKLYSPKSLPQNEWHAPKGCCPKLVLLEISYSPQNKWFPPKWVNLLQNGQHFPKMTPKLGTLPQNEWQTPKESNSPPKRSNGSPPVP